MFGSGGSVGGGGQGLRGAVEKEDGFVGGVWWWWYVLNVSPLLLLLWQTPNRHQWC